MVVLQRAIDRKERLNGELKQRLEAQTLTETTKLSMRSSRNNSVRFRLIDSVQDQGCAELGGEDPFDLFLQRRIYNN